MWALIKLKALNVSSEYRSEESIQINVNVMARKQQKITLICFG